MSNKISEEGKKQQDLKRDIAETSSAGKENAFGP